MRPSLYMLAWVVLSSCPLSVHAADAPVIPASSPDVPAAEVLTAIHRCRELIRAAQLADGAFAMSLSGERVRIVPYFTNNAAMGLLAAHQLDPQPDDVARVRRWIDWYVAHIETDGTIYDHVGTRAKVERTDKRDSTDSYAATFLQLIARHAQADPPAATALRRAAEQALKAIELTYDPADGLTWATPTYKIKYLMDNLEVALALDEAIPYFESVGAPAAAKRAGEMLERNRRSLAAYWRADLGYFAWAKDAKDQYHVRLEKWYPDALVNLFAIAHVNAPPPVLWTKLQSQFKDAKDLTPGWWRSAARRAGSEHDVEHHQRENIRFALALPDDASINRVATTLLALASPRGRGIDLAFP